MNVAEADRRVDVVMATYNGARYLPEMLDSLTAQHYAGLRLVACDDGSSDGTPELLEKFDDIPVRVSRNPRNLGARDNFSRALGLADAPYVALADQDDVWMPGKIAAMMDRMAELEGESDSGTPILVFSDLHIVDTDLNLMLPSFYEGTFKSRDASTLGDFAISNHVPGCVILANRALLDAALPVPAVAHMHDWWLCIVAAAIGKIGHVPEPLIKFRRHGANETDSGRQKRRSTWIWQALGRATRPREYFEQRMEATTKLASATNALMMTMEQRFDDRLLPDARRMLKALVGRSWVRRYAVLRQSRSGESPVTDLLVALQMGLARNRTALAKGR